MCWHFMSLAQYAGLQRPAAEALLEREVCAVLSRLLPRTAAKDAKIDDLREKQRKGLTARFRSLARRTGQDKTAALGDLQSKLTAATKLAKQGQARGTRRSGRQPPDSFASPAAVDPLGGTPVLAACLHR